MANLTTENLKTVDDLDFIDSANLSSGFLLGGEGSSLKKFSYEQLKNSVGSIAVVPVSTEKNKSIGEIWIENEVSKKDYILHSFSEIGKINENKKNQIVCIKNILYVLNESGKLFKIDLENKTCIALYPDLNFNFIFVNETLIVFVGNSGSSVKGFNFETEIEYSGYVDENGIGQDEILQRIDVNKVSNFSYPLNKMNRICYNDENEKIVYMVDFNIYNNQLLLGANSIDEDTSFQYQNELTDYSLSLMYYKGENSLYGVGVILVLNNKIENTPNGVPLTNVINVNDYNVCLIYGGNYAVYSGIIRINSSNFYYEIYYDSRNSEAEMQFTEKSFYSDEKILSEIISLKYFYGGFFALQKTIEGNRFAVVKYNLTTDGIKCEVVNIISEDLIYKEIELLCDLESEKKFSSGIVENPDFICAGNQKTNFVAEKLTTEYNSKLKIKMPSGIKKIGLSE